MRDALKRIRKYKDKLTGFDGLEVVHTGYKHSRNVAVKRYADKSAFFSLCDFLASQLCLENNLDVVECARVFQFMRKCCGETYETGRTCYEVLKECKWRFPGWVKCDEIASISNILNRYLGCSYHHSVFLKAEVEVGAGTAVPLEGVDTEDFYVNTATYSSLIRKETFNFSEQLFSSLIRRETFNFSGQLFSALTLRENPIYVKTVISS